MTCIIRESEFYKNFCKINGKTTAEMSKEIIDLLVLNDFINDEVDDWGSSIDDHCTCAEAIEMINELGYEIEPETFLNLQILGPYDCPECGARMEVVDGKYRQVGGFDYDSEPEYEAVWETKRCTNCYYTESNEPDE